MKLPMYSRRAGIILILFLIIIQSSYPAVSQQTGTSSRITSQFQEKSDVDSFKKAEVKQDSSKKQASLFSLFRKGGPFMWPILIFAAICLGFIIERFIFFQRTRLSPREFIDGLENTILSGTLKSVEKLCQEKNYIISRILLRGLRLKKHGIDRVEKALSVAGTIEVASLERGLNVLSALGNIVPMLGFLGTVSGMINAFSNIAAADQVNARLVAGGIEEALLTTAAGLIVAIPTLFFYNYFVHKIDLFIADVERLSSDIVEKMIGDKGGKSKKAS